MGWWNFILGDSLPPMQEHRHPFHEHMISDAVRGMLELVLINQELMMSKIQDILEAVTKEQGQVASIGTLVQQIVKLETDLQTEVQSLLAGNLPPDVQAQVDQAFQIQSENAAALAANAATLTTAINGTAATPAPVAVETPPATPAV